MIKKTIVLSLLVFCELLVYSQSRKNNLFSLTVNTPENIKFSGVNGELNSSYSSLIFMAEYTRFVNISYRFKLGLSLNYQRNIANIEFTNRFVNDQYLFSDLKGLGIGINSMYILARINEKSGFKLNFRLSYLVLRPGEYSTAVLLTQNGVLDYYSEILVDYYQSSEKINTSLNILYTMVRKEVDYNFFIGLTYYSPYMSDVKAIFYSRVNPNVYEETDYKFKFLRPCFGFSIGF
jgi:hypothetical protein